MAPKSTTIAAFRRRLLRWYAAHGRALPWRDTRDPYRILVSEMMLQQTQVSRVLEYYPRFLRRFPTLAQLAAARPQTVMAAWDGMGYYARARNLHAAARTVVREHDGTLPRDPAALETLPGIGRYTAGAVASFAYEQAVPAVDTNVARVIRRYYLGKWGVGGGTIREREIWALASQLVPKDGKRAWRFNQAVMELGAVVCRARKPECRRCPVKAGCKTGGKR